jgi:hypothetical protein
MNFSARLFYCFTIALLGTVSVRAQAPAPFTLDKQFSADQLITTKEGSTITNKIYLDNGKIRSEINAHGMNMVSIVLPDQQKVYSIMPGQKMVLVLPYDPARFKKQMAASEVLATKFDLIGSDTAEGVACNKYKGVTQDGKTYFLWADAARHVPVKMTADDGSFTVMWKNYQAGPQDPSLFEVPAGYQMMNMPAMPSNTPPPAGAAQ